MVDMRFCKIISEDKLRTPPPSKARSRMLWSCIAVVVTSRLVGCYCQRREKRLKQQSACGVDSEATIPLNPERLAGEMGDLRRILLLVKALDISDDVAQSAEEEAMLALQLWRAAPCQTGLCDSWRLSWSNPRHGIQHYISNTTST